MKTMAILLVPVLMPRGSFVMVWRDIKVSVIDLKYKAVAPTTYSNDIALIGFEKHA